MYNQSTQRAIGQRNVRSYRATGQRRHRKAVRSQEQIRLLQLAVCLMLFFAIFIGKGLFPQKLERIGTDILTLISDNLNFQEVLSKFGDPLEENGVLSDFKAFCVEVFGDNQPEDNSIEEVRVTPEPVGIMTSELKFLGQNSDVASRTVHYAGLDRFGMELTQKEELPASEEEPAEEKNEVLEEPQVVPAAGTVISVSDYSGEALPDNYTMDELSLGELETMTPLMGRITSIYGYRDHPISGSYLFHGGLDIGGQTGAPIAAFADGIVEYIGKNDSYGLYLQIDHGNGVKSFYAHCSAIEVSKGQSVAMGDTVARVGSTGVSTGPHLHLELKYNKMHLNPAYYVEFLA